MHIDTHLYIQSYKPLHLQIVCVCVHVRQSRTCTGRYCTGLPEEDEATCLCGLLKHEEFVCLTVLGRYPRKHWCHS